MADRYQCESCERFKFLGDFAGRKGGICNVCRSMPQPPAEAIKPKKKRRSGYTPEQQRRYVACRKYGLTHEEYDSLMEQKECGICEKEGPLVIDHCHSTGRVRGLLCNDCNLGLGRFKDSPELLISAAEYLKNT